MFRQNVNMTFINSLLSPDKIADMHASMKRLLDYAMEATHKDKAPVMDFAGLGARMKVSSAVMTNWKARGISREGALQAEGLFGCSGRWIREGGTEPSIRGGGGQMHADDNTTPGGRLRADEAEALGLLRAADQSARLQAMKALRGMLAQEAKGVKSDHIRELIVSKPHADPEQPPLAAPSMPPPAPPERRAALLTVYTGEERRYKGLNPIRMPGRKKAADKDAKG